MVGISRRRLNAKRRCLGAKNRYQNPNEKNRYRSLKVKLRCLNAKNRYQSLNAKNRHPSPNVQQGRLPHLARQPEAAGALALPYPGDTRRLPGRPERRLSIVSGGGQRTGAGRPSLCAPFLPRLRRRLSRRPASSWRRGGRASTTGRRRRRRASLASGRSAPTSRRRTRTGTLLGARAARVCSGAATTTRRRRGSSCSPSGRTPERNPSALRARPER